MILTDKTILEEIKQGSIVVHPCLVDALGTNSIDLTLNKHFKTYVLSEGYLDCKKSNSYSEDIFPESGFILKPGELYICSTNEYTETHNHVPVLSGKSSLARLGLSVHVTAGFGDVGFCGTWTLEITVVKPLKVYPNMPIAQISYETISEKPVIPYNKKKSAKYNNQRDAGVSKMNMNFDNNFEKSDFASKSKFIVYRNITLGDTYVDNICFEKSELLDRF